MAHANKTPLTMLSICGALALVMGVVGCGGATGGMRAVGGSTGSGTGGTTGGQGGMAFDAGMGGAVMGLDCPNGVNPSAPLLTDFSATSWSNTQGKWTSAGGDLTGSKYSNGGGMTDTGGVTTVMTNTVDATAGNFVLTGSVASGDYA